ncbi:hypothetical protein KA005_62810, partial [bacterium]|nr:hypothetical protein [bacterium]
MKLRISITVVILCGLVSSFGCSRGEKAETQIGEWKGHVEDENGIDVFVNPVTPILSEVEYDLQEDLSIGNEDDDNFLFYRAIDIAVDQDESIYVL